MKCEAVQERMMEWMDGRVPPDLANELKAHVDACPGCQAELAATQRFARLLDRPPAVSPTPELRKGVYAMIAEEMAGAPAPARRAEPRPARPAWAWLRLPAVQALAACALVAAGYLAGLRRAPAPTPPTAASAPATQQDVAEIRAQIGQLVGYTLEQQEHASADQRLETVLTTAAEPKPNQNAIDSLITALAMDPSVNVRLSAVQALYAHADQPIVRTAVAVSLPRESSPLVQLAMIDFLTAARDRSAIPVLTKLSTTADDPSVKEAAGRALAQLEPAHF
ncbi:MAG TPA: zf-HC2 domain-containing protein [Opitutaceae bacterium]|jgi:anti-sigma factor RsiW|nr:zf-HC2 domain-containing protein [Opitutaceae bacterium]